MYIHVYYALVLFIGRLSRESQLKKKRRSFENNNLLRIKYKNIFKHMIL